MGLVNENVQNTLLFSNPLLSLSICGAKLSVTRLHPPRRADARVELTRPRSPSRRLGRAPPCAPTAASPSSPAPAPVAGGGGAAPPHAPGYAFPRVPALAAAARRCPLGTPVAVGMELPARSRTCMQMEAAIHRARSATTCPCLPVVPLLHNGQRPKVWGGASSACRCSCYCASCAWTSSWVATT